MSKGDSKAAVRAWIAGGSLEAYPDAVGIAARRLLTDTRMVDCWANGFGVADFRRAAQEFDVAIDRDKWSSKTQRERNDWARKFDKAVDQLIELMAEGPTTPEQWGFPARDNVLMNVIYRMGFPLPEASSPEFFPKMLELEAAADAECWTIADSLRHYQKQQVGDCTAKQILKKPGDERAGRAQFIVNFRRYSNCSAKAVADVASVMFDDKTINDRLVRRLTAAR